MVKEQIVHSGLPVDAGLDDVAITGDRPNILLICTDQLRADFLAINGHPMVQTPHIDRLAQSGVNFRQSMSECPVCCPARRILMTGMDSYGVNMYQNRDLQDFPEGPKLAEVLTANGYQTYGVGKMHTWPPRNRMGFGDIEINEEGRTAGFRYPDDYQQFLLDNNLGAIANAHGMGNNQYGYRPNPLPEWATTTGWTADRAMRFMRRRDTSKPFFLYASFDRPHPPLIPPAEFYEIYRDKEFPLPVQGDWCDKKFQGRINGTKKSQLFPSWGAREDVIQESLRAYAACITQIDARIGQMLGTLRETGALENTWIMFTADHGDMTFDHGLVAKGSFHNGSSMVPYIVVPPKSAAKMDVPVSAVGRTDTTHAVGLQDFMPTILDIAGCPLPENMTGQSVLPLIKEEEVAWRDHIFGNCGPLYSSFDGRYRYQWDGVSGEEMLFDQLEDTKDEHDLADLPAYVEVKAGLRAALRDWMAANDDIRVEDGEMITVPVRVVGSDTNPLGFKAGPWNNRGWR